jgi:hypothetical protein
MFTKKISIAFIAIVLTSVAAFAQPSIKGNIKVNGESKANIELKSQHPVDLYAAFRKEEHKINFSFEGTGLQTTADQQEYCLVQFTSIIFFNGKPIETVKRKPFPFFPGDMLMPVETFDFIPSLQQLANKNNGLLPKGNYEIRLQANSTDAKGIVNSAIILFSL